MLDTCSGNAEEVIDTVWMHLRMYAIHLHSALVATMAASPGETHGLATLLAAKDSNSPQL